MVAGLRKLKIITEKVQIQKEQNMSAFMITGSDSYFSTHPSLDNRIQALEENYKLA